MKGAARSVESLLTQVQLESAHLKLPPEAMKFPVFVPLPYLSRIERGSLNDPLLRQVLPTSAEAASPAHFSKDPLEEASATVSDGLLQKYRKRVLVIASAACAINCRYCFRRHFPYETAAIGDKRWAETLETIQSDISVNEIILSGGDPLTVSDEKLEDVFSRISQIDHIRRIRIHTRLPIVIPQRITNRIEETFWRFRKSRKDRQTVVVVHSNHPNELDDSTSEALRSISESATQLLNQSVLLAGVNDNADTLVELSEKLLAANTLPYYLHQLDPIEGTAHFQVDIQKGVEIINAMRADLPGYAVPRFVQELAGEPNKTVLA